VEIAYHTQWVQAFKQMPDPRKARGKRYPWWVLLTLLASALVSGQHFPSAIHQWVQEHGELLRRQIWPRLPSDATLRRALQQMPLAELQAVMVLPGAQESRVGEWQAHALDGKTVRGATTHGQPVHVVREVVHGSGAVVQQQVVEAKTNEIPVVQHLLAGRDVHGIVITVDALHTQQATTQLVLQQGGHYLLIAKANQPTLYQAIADWFDAPAWPEEQRMQWSQTEKAHGRLETRLLERIVCPTRLPPFWPGVRQVLRRTCRTVELPSMRQRKVEMTYALTDLAAEQADLDILATLWRGHWTIENRVHHVLDVTWREDACQVHTGAAPVALTLLRSGITDALRRAGVSNIAAALRSFAAAAERAVAFVAG
jgi:predicted transposase YbfD/YdcC